MKGISTCDKGKLYEGILADMGGFGASRIERWPQEMDSFQIDAEKSVYSSSVKNSLTLAWACCAPIFKVKDSLVSGDKLGHFLESGFEMFDMVQRRAGKPAPSKGTMLERSYDANKKMSTVGMSPQAQALQGEDYLIAVSQNQEKGSWGLLGNGVWSNADIAANFEGYRFWTLLTDGPDPYFRCENGQWKFVREFKWEDYVSDAWDEGINCSQFVDKSVAPIAENVKRLSLKEHMPSTTCPVQPAKCGALVRRLGIYADRILHKDCFRAGGGVESTSTNSSSPKRVDGQSESKGSR